ncbi:MAG TPA: VirB8/TrbF family protein [Candidatus Megaira endosymbiont of Nemacystus decipiens]|nr:VirB8/TrbF family protein [Candidatus Megaera endosymbiont of Nemacystus decipiens]
MNKIREFFARFRPKEDPTQMPSSNEEKIEKNPQLQNWYQDRYDNIVVQRNLLFLLLISLVLLSIIAVGVVAYVVNTKKFDPFVIQIDDTTGAAQVVNPNASNIISGNEALAQYFIKKYVTARETYNPVDFEKEARKTIRLLSTSRIYWAYRGYLRNEAVNPQIRYGQKNTTFLLVKSWSKLSDTKYIMRFSINETGGARKSFHKIAVVEFQYAPMELTEKDKDINPIGFQVIEYRVDDDNS